MARPLLILVACSFIFRPFLTAQATDERLRLINADILERSTVNGQAVQELTGNVKFQKGEMDLTTNRAVFYRRDDRTHLKGEVVMLRPGERLTCDSLIFYNGQDMLHAMGDVHFVQEEHTLDCQDLIFWTELDSGIARNDVVMTQEARQLTANEFRYQKTDGTRGASFHAYGTVVVQEGEREIRAQAMDYHDHLGVLELSGDASMREAARENERSLRGKRIRLQYAGEMLQSGLVDENAEATALIWARLSPNQRDRQAFTDVLTSRGMEAEFIDDKLRHLWLAGMASSTYHVVEDTILQGVNSATGDTMAMDFDTGGKLIRIQVLGGARGRFVPEAGNSDVDTVVVYRSDYIDYDILGEVTYLERGARVDFKENGLASGYIRVTWQNNLLRAEEAFEEKPTLHQVGSDPMYGQRMEFDLSTERGRVVKGRTQLEDGHYHGELVHRYPEDVYYVRTSLYTTCSLDTPHFYFGAQRMKMLQGDKVIAKPIILYIMDVPILGLPFIVFPNESGGRRTGWIMPSYGQSRDGRYLKGLGYFWVISDYADLRSLVDIYDERGVTVAERVRYRKRYKYVGSFQARLLREVADRNLSSLFTDRAGNNWSGSWRHQHNIDPTQKLSIDAQYTSNPNINRRYGMDQRTRLEQRIKSNASYSKHWPGTPYRLSVGLQEQYDLQALDRLQTSPPTKAGQENVEKTRTLPQISFGRGSRPLFTLGKSQAPKWYHNLSLSLGGKILNRQRIYWTAIADTADSLFWPAEEDRTIENKTSAKNNLGIGLTQNVFKYLTTSLNLGIIQDWTPTHRTARLDSATGSFMRNLEGGPVLYDETQKLSVRHTGSVSLTAKTALYGLLPLRLGSLEAIRHVIKPSITYRYTPDFSRPLFGVDLGYFQHSSDPNDEPFDRFAGSSVGGTPRRESQTMSMSISNLFQTKRVIEDKDVKTNILNWNMSTAYNFTADSLNFSPIHSSFRSPFLKKLNLDISMDHDIYEWDSQAGKRINKTLPVPRLSRMNASSRLRLSGKRFSPLETEAVEESIPVDTLQIDEDLEEDIIKGDDPTVRRGTTRSSVSKGNLWEATLALRYSLVPTLDPQKKETFWLNSNFKFNIGPGWAITYNSRFNLLSQELVSHHIQIYREIHCWEFFFDWNPSGVGRGFLFRINVINADLKDIKYENKGGRQNTWGF
ncbi:putative LPS assembly protein LptD [Candidatus Neomarinimicrobiota bacterium]